MGRRTTMEKELIRKLATESIKKWKNQLGFSRWKIDAKIAVFNRVDGFPQDGDIVINYPKKQATILIGKILKSSVEEIVVHEMIHLMLWPLDQNMMLEIKRLPKGEQKRIEDNFLGKLEKVVDHIAKSFLRTGK